MPCEDVDVESLPERLARETMAKWPVWPGLSGAIAMEQTRADLAAAIRAALDEAVKAARAHQGGFCPCGEDIALAIEALK